MHSIIKGAFIHRLRLSYSKRGRKPGSKKVTAKTEEQPATKTKETAKEEVKAEAPAKPTPKKAKKEETPAIPEEKEVILPELEFGSETDDFIPIEDLPSEKNRTSY